MNRITATPAVLAIAITVAACDTTRPIDHGTDATASDCARCHGFPPATVASGGAHPSGTDCSTCHPGTVAPDGTLVAGGLHMNGTVEASGAPHALPFLADHPGAALAGIGGCTSCHGADYGGGTTGVSCNGCHAGIAASGPDWKTNCTFCHGTRTADVTSATPAAAPPQAVAGATSASDPKVGAHQAHLVAGTFSNPLPCASCHAVPSQAEALTHFSGGGAPGAISFGAVATKGAAGASYAGGTCAVYCHGAGTEFANPAGTASPAWTATSVACGSCHGVPPASGPTVSGQTAHAFHVSGRGLACATCHPVPPGQLDLHVNGTKDVVVQPTAGGPVTIAGWDCTSCHGALGVAVGHAVPFVGHPDAALADLGGCASCHGADYGGGTAGVSCNGCHATFGFSDWKTNCTFCHGTRTQGFAGTPAWLPAPPEAVAGATATSDRRVGAHQKHVGNGSVLSNGVACTECHPAATDLAHVGGGGNAQLAWGALATNAGATATMTSLTCANYCHGATLPGTGRTPPTWAPPSTMTCGSCHQANPTTGEHPSQNSRHSTFACSVCHGSGFTAGTSVNPALHVDGAIFKDPSLNWQGPPQFTTKSCDPACHGRKNW